MKRSHAREVRSLWFGQISEAPYGDSHQVRPGTRLDWPRRFTLRGATRGQRVYRGADYRSWRTFIHQDTLPSTHLAMSTLNYSTNQPVEDEKDVKNYYDEEHVESAAAGDKNVISADHTQYIHDAADAVGRQKEQSIMSALKTYRRGVIFSIIFSS